MKAFTKFCLILSGVLILLGFAGIGAGFAMGAKPDQLLMQITHPFKPGFSKLEGIEEIPDSADRIDDSSIDALPSLSGDPSEEAGEYYEFDNLIKDLDFELSLCSLEIYCHDKDFISLEARNTQDTFRCAQNGDKLQLKDRRDWMLFQSSMDQALYLRLYLPKRLLEDVDIKVGAGNITLDQLAAKKMDIQCGTGEMTAGTLSGENISIQIGTGEVKADTISASEKCSVESGTGDISLSSYEGNDLDLNCGLGEISVTAAGKPSLYDYELNCVAGEVRINHHLNESVHHHDEESGPGCHIKVDNQADHRIRLQCGLGDIELNFTEED